MRDLTVCLKGMFFPTNYVVMQFFIELKTSSLFIVVHCYLEHLVIFKNIFLRSARNASLHLKLL